MTKRLLFIRYKTSEGIEGGGERLTTVNMSYIKEIMGDDGVEEYNICDNFKENTLSNRIF
jgi:hypothetical protein